ncbi:hypothetical protein CDV55_107958 [Aspergillus turcosus]|nr:hypothetical protein CDV55_107958 [Aspergillus turcosus]
MAPNTNLCLWVYLLVAAAFANQTPSDSSNTCFTSNSGSPKENFEACCPRVATDEPQSGTGYAGDDQFTYHCGYYSSSIGEAVMQNVDTIQDCAALCAKNASCVAATWDYRNSRCYITTEKTSTDPDPFMVVLVKRDAEADCSKVDAAVQECKEAEAAKCKLDKDALTTTMAAECNRQKEAAEKQAVSCEKSTQQLRQERDSLTKQLGDCQKEAPNLSNELPFCQEILIMPRKDFQRDLIGAKAPSRFPHLSGVRAGDHDGSITFTFADASTATRIDFQAIVSDTQDYPESHTYFVFTTSEDPPSSVATVLDNAPSRFSGVSLGDFLTYIDELIQDALGRPDIEADDDDEIGCGADETDFEDDDGYDWDLENEPAFAISVTDEKDLLRSLRRDLRAVKNAGLKVGYLGTLTGAVIVSVSCRIGRLGISEEAMKSWDVRASEYLVLLIRYPGAYVHFPKLLALGDARYSAIQFHVGLCDSYKPSSEEAMRAFQRDIPLSEEGLTGTAQRLRPLFIEQPLNSLLNERFLRIMELRYHLGLSWTGAELYIQRNQGRKAENGALPDDYFEPDTWSPSTPALFQDDHLSQGQGGHGLEELSLPLIAMQFTLRHFAKCTEFCLVCHCKIRESFEAIKPYVCSNGLCLFQYMALGMGPSLEHEIQYQPSVVDLLISLTYARAGAGRLTDFPAGLGLKVPGVLNMKLDEIERHLTNAKGKSSAPVPICYSGYLIPATMACRLDKAPHPRLKHGDWVVIFQTGTDLKEGPWHCRVQATDAGAGEVQLSSPIVKGQQPSASELLPGPSHVKFIVYERNFDDLGVNDKRAAVRMLLDTLPSVDKMKAFLAESDKQKLAAWKDVISPAALDVLRWVVASNRSFILEDTHSDDRVTGMESYKQFRLVQGAPDKEQRFRAAVAANATTKTGYPTIFAWHGSPVYNWHSILREGLHFKEVIHGRAFGDGVYLSNQFQTSMAYTPASRYDWPQSNLKIEMLVSLNELVNAPAQFKCTNPYVVTQLDWIQPRYLFVKCESSGPSDGTANAKPSAMYKQDPKYPARGPDGTPICIPISALNSQRRHSLGVLSQTDSDIGNSPSSGRGKKRKRGVDKMPAPEASTNIDLAEDDVLSVATAFDDLQILLSEDEGEAEEPPTVKPSKNGVKSDFEPGTLKKESLPLLTPPQYATTPATKVLQQHLQATLKVQAREPLHDLGWYIDPDFITTVYQWIVELHSFDPKLPLAKDLKQANMKSVVLELRFPPGFPMSPPFVRVIRPRFLEFANGGGGHVTAGGAMCMELLTNSGWLPTASIESVLLQVRMAITNTEPRPARLASNRSRTDYSVGEAVEAYKRACLAHGWQIPEDIQRLSWA